MADVIKKVNEALPPGQRYIVLSESDVATGDVIRILTSLGRTADTVTIEASAGSDLSIKINSRVFVNKRREYPEEHPAFWTAYNDISARTEAVSGADSILVGNPIASTFVLNDLVMRDMEVTYTTGTFTIFFS